MERLLTLDMALSQRLTLSPVSRWRQAARLMAHLGDGPYIFGILGLVYLLSWLTNEPMLRRDTIIIALIVLAAMIIVTLIKFLVRRQRPRPPGEFVTFQYDKYSFPSGHSARLSALTVSVIYFYPPLGWTLSCIALGVAVARVAVGVHYMGDILAGLLIGALVAWGAMLFCNCLPP